MHKTKENLYHSIGGLVLDRINGDWDSANVSFEIVEDDVYALECSYHAGASQQYFDGGFVINDLMIELHQAMAVEGLGMWKKAFFSLFPSGDFDIDFEYE